MKKIILSIVLSAMLLVPAVSFAADLNLWQAGGNDTKSDLNNIGMKDANLVQAVINLIKFVLGFLGLIAVIIVLYAGFKWMTSGGNSSEVEGAKKMLWAGLIGLIIILGSYAIANFVITRITTDVINGSN